MKQGDRAAAQETRCWYRRKDSISLALRLVVIRRIPLKLTHKIEQAFLASAGDEFLQGLRNGGLFRALAAEFQGALDQFGVD
jgi:hypothetical protein